MPRTSLVETTAEGEQVKQSGILGFALSAVTINRGLLAEYKAGRAM
jgi:hypothetical protein